MFENHLLSIVAYTPLLGALLLLLVNKEKTQFIRCLAARGVRAFLRVFGIPKYLACRVAARITGRHCFCSAPRGILPLCLRRQTVKWALRILLL